MNYLDNLEHSPKYASHAVQDETHVIKGFAEKFMDGTTERFDLDVAI